MTFDPVLHLYHDDDGKQIPGCTEILTKAGYIDNRWYNEEARDRGSAVHDLCERYAMGERKDKKGRNLAELEYVNAFATWMRDMGAYAIMTECLVCGEHNGRKWGGKFDLLCEIDRQRVLIDIKTGVKAKWHPIQLAGYSLARIENTEGKPLVNPDRVATLYIHADGTYKENRVTGLDFVDSINKFREALGK